MELTFVYHPHSPFENMFPVNLLHHQRILASSVGDPLHFLIQIRRRLHVIIEHSPVKTKYFRCLDGYHVRYSFAVLGDQSHFTEIGAVLQMTHLNRWSKRTFVRIHLSVSSTCPLRCYSFHKTKQTSFPVGVYTATVPWCMKYIQSLDVPAFTMISWGRKISWCKLDTMFLPVVGGRSFKIGTCSIILTQM